MNRMLVGKQKRPRLLAVILGCACLLLTGKALSDVVFDGTLGPPGGLAGDMVIGEEWGTREGANLFHSFLFFDIFAGESALFTSSFTGSTQNIIARVTGGAESLIDGPLSVDIPGAALWLVNPSGMVFGEGAVVDVQGAFTATTADYLLLGQGGKFAADPSELGGTVLTMGNPSGFGFISPSPASIQLEGASINAGEGGSVSLVAGGLDLHRSEIEASGGRVDLVAVAGAGEVLTGEGSLDTGDFDAFGDISLRHSTVSTDGDGGGRIRIIGGQLVVRNGSALTARSDGQDGAGIGIEVDSLALRGGSVIDTSTSGRGQAGDVVITAADTVAITGNDADIASGIFANTARSGDAGTIHIETGVLEMTGAANLEARSSFTGNGGEIVVHAASAIHLTGLNGGRDSLGRIIRLGNIDAGSDAANGGSIHLVSPLLDISNYFTVQSDTRGSRDGGSIRFDVDDLWMSDAAQVTAETGNNNRGGTIGGVGAAPTIVINASNEIRLSNEIKSNELAGYTYISVSAQKGGRSGELTLNARIIELNRGLLFATANQTAEDSGSITLNASEYVLMTNEGVIESALNDSETLGADIIINTPSLTMEGLSQISTNTLQSNFNRQVLSGRAGSIYLNVGELVMRDSVIEASSCGCSAGSAGDIFVNATGRIFIEGLFNPGGQDFGAAGIRSQTFGGETGGNIFIQAPEIHLANQGTISTSSPATAAEIQQKFPDLDPGNAGRIDIVADFLTLDSGATITTSALEAAGGIISLDVSELIYVENASITAEALGVTPGDDGGNVFIADPSVIVLDGGSIVARANAGNGGNIGIVTEALIPGLYGTIDASSRAGLDGQVIIDSPNQQVTSVTVLDEPTLDVAELIEDPCVIAVDEVRSSLTVEGQGGLPPSPDDYQPAPSMGPDAVRDSRQGSAVGAQGMPVVAAACGAPGP